MEYFGHLQERWKLPQLTVMLTLKCLGDTAFHLFTLLMTTVDWSMCRRLSWWFVTLLYACLVMGHVMSSSCLCSSSLGFRMITWVSLCQTDRTSLTYSPGLIGKLFALLSLPTWRCPLLVYTDNIVSSASLSIFCCLLKTHSGGHRSSHHTIENRSIRPENWVGGSAAA